MKKLAQFEVVVVASASQFVFIVVSQCFSVARENFEITPPDFLRIAKYHATTVLVENSHFLLKFGQK